MSDNSQNGPFAALYRFFRSLKLAVVLILILTTLSVVATLIPQGREQAFYLAQYPMLGALFIGLGFDAMFTSFLFLLPTGLIFTNIAVCAIRRFVTRWKSKAKRRYGPDILHLGLLVLMVGGMITFYGRTEEMIQLRVGQSAEVPGGYIISLDDFRFERYEDGAPKDWLSVVSVTKDGQTVRESAVIEVNSPLKLDNLNFYQSSYSLEEGIVLADLEGNLYWLRAGDIIPLEDDAGLVVRGVGPGPLGAENIVMLDVWKDHEVTEQRTETAGTAVGQWVITEVVHGYSTGLQMVHDPGYKTVLVALIMVTVGLFVTYIQKIGDNQV